MIFSENRFPLFRIMLQSARIVRTRPVPGLDRGASRLSENIMLDQKIAAVRATSERRRADRGGEG
jgi:hypothetical protein